MADDFDFVGFDGFKDGFDGFFGANAAVGVVNVFKDVIVGSAKDGFAVFFCDFYCFFVGAVEVFGVVPGVFDGIKNSDIFFQIFFQRDAAGVVWVWRNN